MALEMTFRNESDGRPLQVGLRRAVVAGWTARDRAAVDHHIAELAELGVPPPSQVPLYYHVAASLLTQSEMIEVVGEDSSGEVEPLLLDDGEALWLGLASDHTDRALERHSVAFAKQACAKPVAPGLWRFAEVANHLDRLCLRSWLRAAEDADWVPYQDGTLAAIRPLPELIAGAPDASGPERLGAGTAMLCGTLGVLSGGVRATPAFRMELEDPVLGRRLTHHYRVEALPLVA